MNPPMKCHWSRKPLARLVIAMIPLSLMAIVNVVFFETYPAIGVLNMVLFVVAVSWEIDLYRMRSLTEKLKQEINKKKK